MPILAQKFGYTNGEMHEALKFEFLRVEEEGKPVTVRSTTELDTSEWEDLMSKIRMWAAIEYGVNIPEPNQTDWL